MLGRFLAALTVLCLGLITTACTSAESTSRPTESLPETTEAPQADKDNVFVPPTMAPETALALPSPSSTPSVLPTLGATPRPSATAVCSNNLQFIEDLTIPDGLEVKAGTAIDKRWLVENSGTCNWGTDYRLKLIEGPSLGSATELALYPALSGSQANIRILFQAPGITGPYRSAWQAHAPDGSPFGDIIYIDIQVIE